MIQILAIIIEESNEISDIIPNMAKEKEAHYKTGDSGSRKCCIRRKITIIVVKIYSRNKNRPEILESVRVTKQS